MPVSNLSPFQDALRSAGATSWADILRVANSFFGSMRDRVPPGSTILEDDGGSRLTYRDAEGFTHTLTRALDGRSPEAGAIRDNTDRPILPTGSQAGEQNLARQLVDQLSPVIGNMTGNAAATSGGQAPTDYYQQQIANISAQLAGQNGLAGLSPEEQALQDQINQAIQARLQQQFTQDQGRNLTRQFGNRINQSSVAINALGNLLQNQGIVQSQALSDAATRELALRQAITESNRANQTAALSGYQSGAGLQQGQTNSLLDILANLTGQGTQRDIARSGIEQQMRQLEEMRRQFDVDTEFKNTQADIAVKEANKSKLLEKALGAGLGALSAIPGIGTAGAIAGKVATAI